MGKYLMKIKGVFYEETTITLGTGHTQKTQRVKNYCLAEQLDDETVEVSFLGNEGQPTGIVVKMPYDEFLNRYTFEPDYKIKTKEEREHDKHVALAERHRSRKELNSAEWEYTSALKIDPESIRANFGIGTLYIEMGQTEKAKSVFRKLSQVEAIFEEENKHIFNEFGIELRKAGMAEEALSNYMKALEISPHDEHLYFNIARLYYDARDWEFALQWVEKCVSVNPAFREARQFESLIRNEMHEHKPSGEPKEGGPDSGPALTRISVDELLERIEVQKKAEGEQGDREDTPPDKSLPPKDEEGAAAGPRA